MTKLRPLAAALAAGSALALAGVAAAQVPLPASNAGDALFRATTLNISAYGEARAAPDQATVTVGVTTQAETAAEAARLNAAQMSKVVAAIRAQGVAERDVQTSGVNLNPRYVYAENLPPRITGYEATNQVTVTVKQLARLGATLDAVVAAGSNQIQGVSFGLQDPRPVEDQARRAAVQALTAKADLYAAATSHRVVRLVTLGESGGYQPSDPPGPMMAMASRSFKEADSTPVSPGELKVRVDVSGLYELAR